MIGTYVVKEGTVNNTMNLVIPTICFEGYDKNPTFKYVFCGNLPKQILNKSRTKMQRSFWFYYAIVLLKSLIPNGPSRQAEDKSDRYPTQQLKVDRIESERCLYIDNIGSSRNFYDKRVRG